MNCDAIIEDLQAFLDNELQPSRRGEIEFHLKACKDCSQMVSDLGDLSNLLRSCDVPTPTLPTGREILIKTNFAHTKENSFSQLFHSVYTFVFKHKAPVLATISAVAILGVVVKISNFTPYSQAPTASNTAQERIIAEDFSKPSIQAASKEQEFVDSSSVIKKESATSTTDEVKPGRIDTLPTASEKFYNSSDSSAPQEEGGLTGNISGNSLNFVPDSKPPSQPSAPNDLATDNKNSIVEENKKLQARDELEKQEPARSITIEKDVLAKKESKPSEGFAKPSPTIAEEITSDKNKERLDNRRNSEKEASTISRNDGGKGLDDSSSGSNPTNSNGVIVITPKAKTTAKSESLPLSKPGAAQSVSSGSMVQTPASTALPEEKKSFLIKSTQLFIEIAEADKAKSEINKIVKEQQGSLSTSGNEKTIKVAISVPVSKLESTLVSLRKLGKVITEKNSEQPMDKDDLEKGVREAKRTESKDAGKKSDEQATEKRKQSQPPNAIINLILEIQSSK
jgi:hypothetical protein